jgi:putative lipoic acid-binding regulatory protein
MKASDTLLQFPCDFPIKVMGKNVPEFTQVISDLICQHAPDFDPASLEIRASSKANYIGLTATIRAASRAQLDALYLALTGHPLVKIVL